MLSDSFRMAGEKKKARAFATRRNQFPRLYVLCVSHHSVLCALDNSLPFSMPSSWMDFSHSKNFVSTICDAAVAHIFEVI